MILQYEPEKAQIQFFFFFLFKLPPHSVEKMPEEGVRVASGGRNDFVVQSNLRYGEVSTLL